MKSSNGLASKQDRNHDLETFLYCREEARLEHMNADFSSETIKKLIEKEEKNTEKILADAEEY